jgi:oligosaccharide repeat unit polymerase
MGLFFFILICLSIIVFYKMCSIQIFEPISILLILTFFLPFVFYPLLKSFSFDSNSQSIAYFNEIKEPLFIVLIVFVFWALGIATLKDRSTFKLKPFNFKERDRYFAVILYIIGVIIFFLTFLIARINFITALANPLETRFQIINTTGAYHLRNFALWFMWSGWFLLLCLKLQGKKIGLLKLFCLFGFVIFLSLPLGQRYQLIFPFIFLMLLLKYCNKIKSKTIYFGSIMLLIILPILALYRELGKSETGLVNFSYFFETLGGILEEKNSFFSIISDRFESIAWFNKFWVIRDNLSMSFFESIRGLLSLFLPASFTGGVKGIDIDTYLNMKVVGSMDFGTPSFTLFPEWYLNFGYFGFPIMAFVSGLLVVFLNRSVKNVGVSIFSLALFADGFFLKLPLINFNTNGNVTIVYHLIFALIVVFFYELFHFKKNNYKKV